MSDIALQDGPKGDMNSGESTNAAGSSLLANSTGPYTSDIKHAVSTETPAEIYNKHTLVKGTFPWSTSDPVGKILFMFENHPSECNWLVDYFSKVFVAWLGFMMLEIRILGTAFMGGSLAFVLVPPTFTRAQVAAMTREDLSIFDYVEVDPKDINTMSFSMKDFRPQHFHYGPLNGNDATTFGGHIVCMVFGKLNISPNTEGASLDILVRTKGQYTFRQPQPLLSGGIPVDQNFPNFSTTRASQHVGCDDAARLMDTSFLPFPAAWPPQNGFVYAMLPTKAQQEGVNAFILPLTQGMSLLNGWSDISKSLYIERGIKYQANRDNPTSHYYTTTLRNADPEFDLYTNEDIQTRTLFSHNLTNIAVVSAIDTTAALPTPMQQLQIRVNDAGLGCFPRYENATEFQMKIIFAEPGNPNKKPVGLSWTPYAGVGLDLTNYQRFSEVPDNVKAVMAKVPSGEIPMCLTSNKGATLSLQSVMLQNDMEGFQWPSATSAIFSVNRDGEVVGFIRVSSAGFMTTRSELGIAASDRFRFTQWLPDSSQMPANPLSTFLRAQHTKQEKQIAKMRAQLSLLLGRSAN